MGCVLRGVPHVSVSEKSFRPLSFWLQKFLHNHPALAAGAREREDLRAAFRRVADAETAAHAEPLRIRDGVLLLQTASPVWASRLRHRLPTLLRQIKTAAAAAVDAAPKAEQSPALKKISRIRRLQIQIHPESNPAAQE